LGKRAVGDHGDTQLLAKLQQPVALGASSQQAAFDLVAGEMQAAALKGTEGALSLLPTVVGHSDLANQPSFSRVSQGVHPSFDIHWRKWPVNLIQMDLWNL